MRILLSCAIVLGLALVAPASPQKQADKGKKKDKDKAAVIDGDLLVGKWEPPPIKGIPIKEVKEAKGPVQEFTKDGKWYLRGSGGKGPGFEGTYMLDGNKLTVTISVDGVTEEHKYTVKKLTKTEMIWYEGKMMTSLRRTK